MFSETSLPSPLPNQTYVTISAIKGGSLTLPERFFVSPADQNASKTVPSLSFLLTHPGPARIPNITSADSKSPFRLLFDLGLRSCIDNYTPPQQKHLKTRAPFDTAPGVAAQLRDAGTDPADVDAVLFSHVHYDHHGDPGEFGNATFVVGHGALAVLRDGLGGLASHQHFDADLLPDGRARELPPPTGSGAGEWMQLGPFRRVFDLFGDGAVFVVDTPGHLPGHVNLLCRVGESRWVYLGGDVAHDRRLLSGEREIATWENDKGQTVSIHLDKEKAQDSIKKVQELTALSEKGDQKVEVILAHDKEWLDENQGRMFPNTL